MLIKYGVVQALVSLLSSKDERIAGHAMWVLGNVAADEREALLTTPTLLAAIVTSVGERLLEGWCVSGFLDQPSSSRSVALACIDTQPRRRPQV